MSKVFELLAAIFLLSLPFLILALVWGMIVGALAARKNRSGWLWGILCGVTGPWSLIFMSLIPHAPPGSLEALTVVTVGGTLLAVNVCALPILGWGAYRCPICRGKLTDREWRDKLCSNCGAIQRQTGAARASLFRRTFGWIFLLIILFFLVIVCLPYMGVLDIHQ